MSYDPGKEWATKLMATHAPWQVRDSLSDGWHAAQEVVRLRDAIKKAHALMGEHRHDEVRGVLAGAVNLYGENLNRALERASSREGQ